MKAIFESKPPHNTYWIRFTSKPDEAVENRLGGIGWLRSNDPFQVVLQKPGSGIFGGWTDGEKRQNLEVTQNILHDLGIVYEVKHLTAKDLL